MSNYFSLPEIARRLLIDKNGGTELNGSWPIYVGFLPDSPAQAIVIYDTAGLPDGRIMQGSKIEHPGLQIRIRAGTYSVAAARANVLKNIVDAIRRESVDMDGETTYLIENISRVGTPINLGPEDETGSNRRFNFTLNAVVTYSLRE